MEEKLSPRRRLYDRGMRGLVWLCAGLTCALLLFLIGYIFYRGVPGITWSLLTSQTSYIQNTVGILPNILDTLYIIVVAMVIVLPLGVGAAIYLTEYASNRRLVSVIEFAAETLTGIPSIIFGLVGMLLFVQRLGGVNDADDLLWRDGSGKWFRGKRIPNPNTHGTGCTLSSAIAANLAKGYDLDRSVERAKAYISGALAAMLDLGRGSGPMNHMFDLKGGFAE